VIQAFWLTTLVPGYALLQVFYPQDVRRGLLATITWSYVLTVALMVPVVALAFTVHLSVQTVGTFYFALVAVSAVVAVRYGGLQRLGWLLRSNLWFEVGLVLVAVALTVPLGAIAHGDTFAHSAKVRYIRDVGFYLQDAYSPLAVIETKWHVNVHHAYFAIASWIGGAEPVDLWFRSAWFFRLLALGGVGFLATTVFRSRWIGAVAMLGSVAVLGTKMTIVMPFSVSGFVIAAVLLALVVSFLDRPSMGRYTRLWLCSLSLAALHVGTWFLAALCTGPVVAIWLMRRDGLKGLWRRIGLGALIMATGVPFLLVSALQPNYVVAQQDDLHVRMIRTIEVWQGWTITIIDPTHYAWLLPVLAILALLAVVSRELRSRVLMVAGILVAGMVFMFTPGIFDALVRLVPYWLVQRFRNFGEIIGLAIVAGGVAWLVRPRLRTTLARRTMAVLVLCGSLAAFRANIQGYVLASASERVSLQDARRLQEAVQDVIPPHSLVAGDPASSLVLPAVHLARVMAADLHHANPSDGGLLERFADAQEFLASGTSDGRRRQIILKHGIDFILIRDDPGGAPPVSFDGVGDVVSSRHGFRLYKVRQ
jgi:hypothetical protein